MADIELIIKIPKEDYKAIKNMSVMGDMTIPNVFDAVRNGTPLPKGHGDLIDKQKLLLETKEISLMVSTDIFREYDVVFSGDVENALAVIKADKAESEKV